MSEPVPERLPGPLDDTGSHDQSRSEAHNLPPAKHVERQVISNEEQVTDIRKGESRVEGHSSDLESKQSAVVDVVSAFAAVQPECQQIDRGKEDCFETRERVQPERGGRQPHFAMTVSTAPPEEQPETDE